MSKLDQFIILAAGRGSRMNALTSNHPKCLTLLAGRSLLEWQIRAAKKAGFKDIHIIGGYLREKLPDDLVHFVNSRWAKTNMVASLFEADTLLSECTCIVSYSDIVYVPDHLKALREDAHPYAIAYDQDWQALWRLRSEDFLNDAESFRTENGFLIDIGEKNVPLSKIHGQYMGLLKFSPEIWREIAVLYRKLPRQQQDSIDMTGFLRILLQADIPIATIPISGGWVEVDTVSDRDIYEAELAAANRNGVRWSHDWRFSG